MAERKLQSVTFQPSDLAPQILLEILVFSHAEL